MDEKVTDHEDTAGFESYPLAEVFLPSEVLLEVTHIRVRTFFVILMSCDHIHKISKPSNDSRKKSLCPLTLHELRLPQHLMV